MNPYSFSHVISSPFAIGTIYPKPPDAPAPAPQEQLLKPKTAPKPAAQPASPAQAAPAKPAPQVQPAKPATPTQTVTRNRKTGEIVKAPAGAKPQQAQTPLSTEVKPKGAKRGPKTDPDAPHNAAIRKEGEKLEAEGYRIIAGGGKAREKIVKTPGGKKSARRPDLQFDKPTEPVRGRNVGKTNADGTPIKRAIDEFPLPA